jgi:hypothetical protein
MGIFALVASSALDRALHSTGKTESNQLPESKIRYEAKIQIFCVRGDRRDPLANRGTCASRLQ